MFFAYKRVASKQVSLLTEVAADRGGEPEVVSKVLERNTSTAEASPGTNTIEVADHNLCTGRERATQGGESTVVGIDEVLLGDADTIRRNGLHGCSRKTSHRSAGGRITAATLGAEYSCEECINREGSVNAAGSVDASGVAPCICDRTVGLRYTSAEDLDAACIVADVGIGASRGAHGRRELVVVCEVLEGGTLSVAERRPYGDALVVVNDEGGIREGAVGSGQSAKYTINIVLLSDNLSVGTDRVEH